LKSEYISTIEEIENMEEQTFEPGKKYNLAASIDVAEGGIVSKQFIKNKGQYHGWALRTSAER
jgi:hypothetical protein